MWIFLNDSFVSVVTDRNVPGNVMVRGRVPGDVEMALGELIDFEDVLETPESDYGFRISVPKIKFMQAMLENIDRIDYDNFKDSVDSRSRHDAYLSVWSTMMRHAMGGYDKGIREDTKPSVDWHPSVVEGDYDGMPDFDGPEHRKVK